MCLGVLSACMPVHHLHAWYLLMPEEGPLELELLVVMGHHVGAWIEPWSS